MSMLLRALLWASAIAMLGAAVLFGSLIIGMIALYGWG